MKTAKIYCISLNITVTHSIKQARRAVKNWHGGDFELDTDTSEAAVINCGSGYVVWIKPNLKRSWIEDASLIAHEATHVMQNYMEYIGEDLPSDEFQAYIVQSATEYLLEEHFKWKEKQRKRKRKHKK